MTTSKKINVCIIGYGRLGSNIYYALEASGKYRPIYMIKHSSSPINTNQINKCKVIFICTQDKNITKAVDSLLINKSNLSGKIVFHTSGAHNSQILQKLKNKGAFTGTFHPVQTFDEKAKKNEHRFNNIYTIIEGDKNAVREGFQLASSIGAKPIELSKEQMALHHVNSVIASNFLVALFSELDKISDILFKKSENRRIFKNGFKKATFFDIYKPLVLQTLKNIESKGLEKSLTGPIERNDMDTIRLHLETINKKISELLPFYILMSFETAKLSLKKKSLSNKDIKELYGVMNNYLNQNKLLN